MNEPSRIPDALPPEIEDALAKAKGNRNLAAKLLGVDRTTLWRRMRRLQMTAPGA